MGGEIRVEAQDVHWDHSLLKLGPDIAFVKWACRSCADPNYIWWVTESVPGKTAATLHRQFSLSLPPIPRGSMQKHHTTMRRSPTVSGLRKTLSVTLLSAALALPTYAQKTTDMGAGAGGSAHVKTEWVVAPANISIAYGRPALKGRPEATLMPAGAEWRTGADVATTLITDKTLKFGTITLQPGSYTVNTVPGETEWHLVLGKLNDPKQWGVPYKKDLEMGRVPMKLAKTAAPVELLTIHVEPGKSAGVLKIEWGTKSASVPFTVLP